MILTTKTSECVCVLSSHLFFLARRIQPFLSLDGEVEFCVRSLLVGHCFCFCFVRKNPSSCDDTEIRTHVPASEGFEITN